MKIEINIDSLIKAIVFLVLLVVVEVASQFIRNVSDFYKVSSINLVETYDNLRTSVEKAYDLIKKVDNHSLLVLPNCLLFIFYLFFSEKMFSACLLAVSFSLDGIFYMQTSSTDSSLSISLFISSIFFSLKLVSMHNDGRSIPTQLKCAFLSSVTGFFSFYVHQHIIPLAVSITAMMYASFIMFPFRKERGKLINVSQFFAVILCIATAACICITCTRFTSGYKHYPVSFNDMYSLIYKEPVESRHARCKTSNNVITTFLFWLFIANHKDYNWSSFVPLILAGVASVYMKSVLFSYRSMNDLKNANYYDLRILFYFVSTVEILTMKSKFLSFVASLSLFVFALIWRIDLYEISIPLLY